MLMHRMSLIVLTAVVVLIASLYHLWVTAGTCYYPGETGTLPEDYCGPSPLYSCHDKDAVIGNIDPGPHGECRFGFGN